MGKALLLIVIASAIGSGIMSLQTQETEWRTAGEMAASDADFLAREAARSGYEVGMSEVAQVYAGRDARADVNAEAPGIPSAGSYDLSVAEQSDATIRVTSTGQAQFINTEHEAETRQHQMEGSLVRLGHAPSAILIRSQNIVPTVLGTSFTISGKDRRPGGTLETGAGENVYGVLAIGPGLADEFENSLSDEQKERIDGRIAEGATSPITPGTENSEYLDLVLAIYTEAMQSVADGDAHVITYTGPVAFNDSETFGSSPTAPKIVYVDGDATFTGDVDGHGVLIVDGNLTILGLSLDPEENFSWTGLVFAREEGLMNYSQIGKTRIDGSLILDSPVLAVEESDIEFEIDPDGTITVNERFAARTEVLGAAISTGSYDMPVTIEVNTGGVDYEPWGDAALALTANINDNNNPRSYDLPNIYDAGTEITVRARSFRKNSEWQKDWYWTRSCRCWRYQWVYTEADGNSNSDWYVYKDRSSGDSDFVIVLRDGDEVPDIGGWNGQADASSYLEDYVDASDRIVLEPNQAISLFELYATNVESSYADFQDVVVLLTLAKESQVTAIVPGEGTLEEDETTLITSSITFNIDSEASVQYSAEAIGRLAKRLSTVNNVATVKALRQRSYNPDHGYETMVSGE